MATIKDDDIIGFHFASETVCRECAKDTEEESVELDDIIVKNDSDTDCLFCDRCKKRIY